MTRELLRARGTLSDAGAAVRVQEGYKCTENPKDVRK